VGLSGEKGRDEKEKQQKELCGPHLEEVMKIPVREMSLFFPPSSSITFNAVYRLTSLTLV